jgi:hypothetical protein
MMRSLSIDGVRLDLAANALDCLMASGAIERALILGWDARELIGVQRAKPHDNPSLAGLVFSLPPGDRVEGISDNGCAIIPAGANLPHLWRRAPAPTDHSICLPWELAK